MRIRSSNFRKYNIAVILYFAEKYILILEYLWISMWIEWENVIFWLIMWKNNWVSCPKNLVSRPKNLDELTKNLGELSKNMGESTNFYLGEMFFGWVVLIPSYLGEVITFLHLTFMFSRLETGLCLFPHFMTHCFKMSRIDNVFLLNLFAWQLSSFIFSMLLQCDIFKY